MSTNWLSPPGAQGMTVTQAWAQPSTRALSLHSPSLRPLAPMPTSLCHSPEGLFFFGFSFERRTNNGG